MSLALSVPILNKKSHRTRAVETFKLWPKFPQLVSDEIFLFKIGTLRAKGIRKNALILYVGGSSPATPTLREIRVR